MGQLCKLMSKPSEKAWEHAMILIAWLYQNKTLGLNYHSAQNSHPIFFTDASNKGDPKDSKRAYGFCCIWVGGSVIASARKLDHSSSASAANEYMAMSNASKQAVWIRQLFVELGLAKLVTKPTIMLADNQTANQWVCDEKITQGNMWILQCYHYVKETHNDKQILVVYCPTKLNIADLFTKGVPREVFDFLVPFLCGVRPIVELLKMIKDQGGQQQSLKFTT